MNEEQFGYYKQRLEWLVPALIKDLVEAFKEEPTIVNRYKPEELQPMAEQITSSFTNVLLGALQFNTPQLLARELNWVRPLLFHRNIGDDQINNFLEIYCRRVKAELPPAESERLLNFLEEVKALAEEELDEGDIEE